MYDLSSQLQSALDPSEHILWSGAPVTGVRFSLFDWFMIPFSLFWFGFSVVWEVLAISAFIESLQDSFDLFVLIFPIFGIPFVIIGYQMLIGRFFSDARNRERTYYGITDRNVIIVTGKEQNIHVLPVASLPVVHLSERRNGIGSIMLGIPLPGTEEENDRRKRTSRPPPSATIELVPNARLVYDTLQQVQAAVAVREKEQLPD